MRGFTCLGSLCWSARHTRAAMWAIAAVALAVMAVSCGRHDGRDAAPPTAVLSPTVGSEVTPIYSREVTLSEARSLLPFELILPSFIPEGTLSSPTLTVSPDYAPDEVEVMYWETEDALPGLRRLRMRITEAYETDMVMTDPSEVLNVRGVQVGFVVGPFAPYNDSEAEAVWNRDDAGFAVEFYWLPDERTPEGPVTDEMRADALRIVESMIE